MKDGCSLKVVTCNGDELVGREMSSRITAKHNQIFE